MALGVMLALAGLGFPLFMHLNMMRGELGAELIPFVIFGILVLAVGVFIALRRVSWWYDPPSGMIQKLEGYPRLSQTAAYAVENYLRVSVRKEWHSRQVPTTDSDQTRDNRPYYNVWLIPKRPDRLPNLLIARDRSRGFARKYERIIVEATGLLRDLDDEDLVPDLPEGLETSFRWISRVAGGLIFLAVAISFAKPGLLPDLLDKLRPTAPAIPVASEPAQPPPDPLIERFVDYQLVPVQGEDLVYISGRNISAKNVGGDLIISIGEVKLESPDSSATVTCHGLALHASKLSSKDANPIGSPGDQDTVRKISDAPIVLKGQQFVLQDKGEQCADGGCEIKLILFATNETGQAKRVFPHSAKINIGDRGLSK